jgi:serine/threonine-protein kinase
VTTAAPDADPLLGTLVADRWTISSKLGEGGMGAVYKASDADGNERAVKVLHREFVKEEQVVSRFYAEAEASGRLDHPNIARVYSSGQCPAGEPFLLMELLKGKALSDEFPEGTVVPPETAIPFVKAVLLALVEAHRQNIVHRDLKPDNVFVCDLPDGGKIVKLLDFGIARVVDAAGGHMRKTKTGMLLGTPGYMSPEQLRNSKSVDPRSDLWSLSTVFYEMLSGRDPYGATTDFARLTAVFTQDAIPVDRDLPQLAPWREFFIRAFQRDINLRFQSAEDMARCIDAVAVGEEMPPVGAPIIPPAPPAPAAPPPRAPQHSAEALAATAHQIQLPANIPSAPPRAPTASNPAVPAAPPPVATPQPPAAPAGGSSKLVWALVCVVLVIATIIAILAIKSFQEKGTEPPAPATATAPVKPPPPAVPPKKK